jgi:hypothetical protein
MNRVVVAAISVSLALPLACAAPAPGPDESPGQTASPASSPAAVDFSLQVLPVEEPVEARVAIPGEKVCFLVTVAGESAEPVSIEAVANGASVVDVRSASLGPGVVGEVWVVPDASAVETTATVDITAARAGVERTEHRSIAIMPMEDERAADARPHFDRWVRWLSENRPELGITESTTWEPIFVSTFLVVSHYAYWSEDWEMVVAWHNMIAPHDWSEIYLRRRGVDSAPGLAFRIDSVSGESEPHAVEPPADVMR